MALAKTAVTILPSTVSNTYSTTKGTPAVVGSAINCTTYYGGEITWKITNNASGPGTPMTLTVQVSQDGANWFDYMTVAGDTANYVSSTGAGVNTGSFILDRGVMYVRAIAYAHTATPVTVEVQLQAVTSL